MLLGYNLFGDFMILYLDLLFIYDFTVSFVLLCFLEKLFCNKVKYRYIAFSSFVQSVIVSISIFNYSILYVFKIIGGLLIGMIAFKKTLFTEKVVKISLFYIVNFAFVGFLKAFHISNHYTLIIALVVIMTLFILESFKKYFIFLKHCEYNVITIINGKTYKLKGFLDTGNKSTYKGIPIVYINKKYETLSNNLVNVIVNGINGSMESIGIVPEVFVLESDKCKKAKKVIICFKDIEEECILNPLLL